MVGIHMTNSMLACFEALFVSLTLLFMAYYLKYLFASPANLEHILAEWSKMKKRRRSRRKKKMICYLGQES
jgi:hypothetical protein